MPKRDKKYTIIKTIKLTPSQALKWNPKAIRKFLENGQNINTNGTFFSLIKKMIPAFIQAGIELELSEDEIQLVKWIYQEIKKDA